MNIDDLNAPELYINRDLSLLAFHHRVYEMAADESLPLLERLRFLCICSSNMDEFFEVRVAALKHGIALGSMARGADGMSATETLVAIREDVKSLIDKQYKLLHDSILPALGRHDICFLRRDEWSKEQAEWVRKFFNRELLPLLTPMSLDLAHPFPRLLNKILAFIVSLEGKDAFGRSLQHAVVQMPRSLPRVILLPDAISSKKHSYVFLSSIIHAHVSTLFPGMTITACHQFRVTRNSELFVDEDEVCDLKMAVSGELQERRYAEAVRLEVSVHCPDDLVNFLLHQFQLQETDLYRVNGPVNLARMSSICDDIDQPALSFPAFTPGLPVALQSEEQSIFDVLKREDVLLYHPYQSFKPVIDLLNQAASDPQVLAIKQTLYRVVPDSPIVNALVQAARAGKDVVAVIELRARFNEEDNIALSERMHQAGVHVVYGVVGYKTHGKMMLIVRREGKKIRRYVHLGTGNYHTVTTRFYTDLGLMSADVKLGDDVHKIFLQLTGMGRASRLKTMLQAPFSLHSGLLERIAIEAENAKQGGSARIVAKVNGLEEAEIIRALYQASQAGVKIILIVRGICCLRPGVKGLSENITVRSVLGRFLEHTRVFYFHNGGHPEVFCASADWMGRNLLRRVETCFPIMDETLSKHLIRYALQPYINDNAGSWQLNKEGRYQRVRLRSKSRDAQTMLMETFGRLSS